MKKMIICLVAMLLSMPLLAHDCDCDCDKHKEAEQATKQENIDTTTQVVEGTSAAQNDSATKEKTENTKEEKAEASAGEKKEESKENESGEKSLWEKFRDMPPAEDNAKKRMKKH